MLLEFMFTLDVGHLPVCRKTKSKKILTNIKNYFMIIESEF